MPDIRYVCFSDTHFGAETSLLTNLKIASSQINPTEPSPVLAKLVECLKYIISANEDGSKKPMLILNGDIMELALTTTSNAAMAFERFIDLVMPDEPGEAELFDRIIYNPGNHDHHLWETARETQYVDRILSSTNWGDELRVPWHTTSIFKNPVRSFFMTRLIQRKSNLGEKVIETAYPNFGLLSQDNRKCVIFHHGHFIESIYMLMSILKTMFFPASQIPDDIWDIEAENFAWIDFFWSALGRSAAVGKTVGMIYEKLQDEKQVKILLSNFAKSLAERYDLPGWGDRMEAAIMEEVLNIVVDMVVGQEKNRPEDYLSEDAKNGLWTYLEGPLKNQIMGECGHTMPRDVTFVFGHTHKPFEEDMNFAGYPEWVNVYNSGGWVVDKVNPQPLHGGSVILLDENLNATSLRMFNEQEDPTWYQVEIQEARHPGDQPGKFHLRMEDLFAQNIGCFNEFSNEVARAINVRKENLKARIYGRGQDAE